MQRFTDIRVRQRSHALALGIYKLTECFPRTERFGLTSQIRRAAVSAPSNIVEGSKRRTSADYARFLNVAEASLAECEYLLLLSRDLGYASEERIALALADVDEISRMLHALRLRVERDS